jgi:hypothetical protein
MSAFEEVDAEELPWPVLSEPRSQGEDGCAQVPITARSPVLECSGGNAM